MIQFRLYYDKDKETAWLNQMAAEGWAMERFCAGFYTFRKCEKGAYVYQVDFSDRLFLVSNDYRELMQEMGIEVVQTWGYWVILRKPASEGKFELYTDVESSIEHYKKIRKMFKVVTIIEMLCMFVEFYCGAVEGIMLGYVFALLFAAILVSLLNIVIRLNNTIADLEEKMTGISKKYSGRNISVCLAAGLVLNGCALLLAEVTPHVLVRILQIVAIVLMLAGLVQTGLSRKQGK